jgi:hypothetical protein
MSTKITTDLTCDGCGKESTFVGRITDGMFRPGLPKLWFKIEPNYQQSVWAMHDFSISGDFCSIECMIKYLREKIKERDNPKPLYVTEMSIVEEGI